MMNTNVKPKFWKLSQGIVNNFTFADMLSCIDEKLVYIGSNTLAKGGSSKTQAEHLLMPILAIIFI